MLGMVVSRFLYEKFPEKEEGERTKLKAVLVSEPTLSRVGKEINLGHFLYLSEEESKSGGRERPSIVADAYEALIGAIFLDGGLGSVKKMRTFIGSNYGKAVDSLPKDEVADVLDVSSEVFLCVLVLECGGLGEVDEHRFLRVVEDVEF